MSWRTRLAPRQSWIPAEWTTTASSRPRVSTTIWRLRPLTFLPASKPFGPPASVVLTDWRIDHGGSGLGVAFRGDPHLVPQGVVEPLQVPSRHHRSK